MNQSDFLKLFKSGDGNALWAAVENHNEQATSEITSAKDAELKALTEKCSELEKECANLYSQTKETRLLAMQEQESQMEDNLAKLREAIKEMS